MAILRYITPLLIFTLLGCAGQPTQLREQTLVHQQLSPPTFNDVLFDKTPEVTSPAQLFALSDAQQQAFLRVFNGHLSHLPANERISRYLSDLTHGFSYKEQTYTASEALALQAGNCMALAIVTKSLADLVDVEIKFQQVTNAPVYDRINDTVMESDHVRARLYRPVPSEESRDVLYERQWVVVDYFPAKDTRSRGIISEAKFLALYYRNRAAEFMLAEQPDLAFAYAKTALRYAANDGDALNIIGLLHRRAGDTQTAQRIYDYVLQLEPTNLNVLHNALALARSGNNETAITEYERRIQALPDPNPYTWIVLAERAFAQSRFETALAMYEKAAYYAPYLHEVYWGQASVYAAQGDAVRAKRVLAEGLEQAKLSATKQSYKAGWYSYRH